MWGGRRARAEGPEWLGEGAGEGAPGTVHAGCPARGPARVWTWEHCPLLTPITATCGSRVWERLPHSLGLVQVWGLPGDTGGTFTVLSAFPCCLTRGGRRGSFCGSERPARDRAHAAPVLPAQGLLRCHPVTSTLLPPRVGVTHVLTVPGPWEPEAVLLGGQTEAGRAPCGLGARSVLCGLVF